MRRQVFPRVYLRLSAGGASPCLRLPPSTLSHRSVPSSSIFCHVRRGATPLSRTHARTLRVCACVCVRARARSQVSPHRQIEKGFPNFPERVANEKVRVAFNNVGKLQTMLIIFKNLFLK